MAENGSDSLILSVADNVNAVFLLSVRSVVFVLRQNVQLVEPEVCSWFHGYTVLCVMDLLEVLSNGLKQCGATDNTTRASRYDRACNQFTILFLPCILIG